MMKVVHRWQGRFAAYRQYRRTVLAISRLTETDALDLAHPTQCAVADARQ